MKPFATVTLICSLSLVCQGSESNPQPQLSTKETQEVIQLLNVCDRAYANCKQANVDKDKVIQEQNIVLKQTQSDLESSQKAQNSIMNSKPLWFTLGALFTGGMVYLIKK